MQNEGYTIKRIASIIGGEVVGNQSDTIIVEDILFDSRLLIDAENTLFFALNSGRNDGHKYIKDLYEKGVKAFVISRKNIENYDVKAQISTLQQYSDAVFVVVDDTFVALQTLAAYHRMQFDIPVVGITGSNGKTVVKEWLYQILSPSMSVCRSPKSYNSQIGVPLSVWQMNHTHDIAIFEAGISRPGEMEKLRDIIKPTIGVFTNIGAAHGKNFENVGQKIEEKLKLFAETNKLVYCSDNIEISSAITNAQIPAFSWSKTDKNADLFVSEINITDKTNIFAIYQNKKLNITIPFIDNASIENAINCWCVALLLNVPNEQIAERMAHLEVVEMRMELKAGVRNCLIINDSYNNDRNALAIALDFMNAQHHDNKVLILSDILQSEQKEEDLYKDIAQLIENKGVDTFIGIGPAISKNMDKACLVPTGQDVSSSKDKACLIQYFYKSTSDFLNNHPMKLFENQIVLLKGARSFEFERIMKVLQQKSHETVLEINLDNLIKNLNYYRGKLKKETKMMVMVKAFAYGSGNYEVSNALAFHHVDYLTVAYADEGVDLRNRGIKLPIMVMTPETNTFDTIILNDLEPDIYSFRCLSQLEDAINQLDRPLGKPVGIHIKVDTGMHRLGFLPEEIDTLIERVKANPSLRIMSVFSHFATSDMPEEDGFVKHQIEQFELMSSKIVAAFPYKIMRHLLNTAGITRFTEYQYDMVRLGIGVYGVAVVDEDRGKLHNVMSLKSTIKQIKEYGPGETIGYGRHGKITKPSRIAVIPIGYADGLRRQLGNGKACFWVNGKPAPIIGNICMDLTMIDVTGIDCQEDDTAVLFDDNHPIEIIAEACDTIPYEIMTRISQRVKRIYTKE
ncbi:MAG: bifunctional UDP-N-acetylmuramoyl-tripeptide:D-alanyl-D-alanine ligase/alanine racemase [Bacteroidales bacterium]|nr:bifunctional UDP-N-acetylmuramoyl-tripeptide:D-alanyl-D-alanine ligase/alanine racemase [Bacteroidales bacterium]